MIKPVYNLFLKKLYDNHLIETLNKLLDAKTSKKVLPVNFIKTT